MKIIYWILKFALLFFILFIGTAYLSRFGLFSVVICVLLFLAGNLLINKKMDSYTKRAAEKGKTR